MAAPSLGGEPPSFWIDTSDATAYPSLTGRVSVDVAVLGGGMTGVAVAAHLKRAGMTVALVEARRLCHGTSGHTTGKLSSLHGLVYDTLSSSFGEDGARAYGEANEAAIERVAALCEEYGIDCDFERVPNYTYTESEQEVSQIEAEVDAAKRVGLPATYTEESDLPYPITSAVRFDGQARFHPRKWCLGLAKAVEGDGSHVFEETRAHAVDEGAPCRVMTDKGELEADRVVVATLLPFTDRGFFFARTHPEREHVLGVRIDGPAPQGMYITAGSPTRSIRSHPAPGGEVVLVSGESHKTGQAQDYDLRYARLERFARERLAARSIDYRWSAQDFYPADQVPYIGRMRRGSDRLYAATGFKAWGMSHAVVAAMILEDQLQGRQNPWSELYNPNRLKPMASATSFLKENANVARRFFGDRLTKRRKLAAVPAGKGAVVSDGRRQVAAYRDAQGELHTVSARCTHMGCIVSWNDADATWDCPCHGSRFGVEGEVIEGPAVKALEPVDLKPGGQG
ncbi:MAG: FAD-dependent oxidoreductase [Actinomycetota bacterium]|nr:FAD-dependent oxidoreductase [Actinomycetota bacterium]